MDDRIRNRLGPIATLIDKAPPMPLQFVGQQWMKQLPGKQLVYLSKLDLDTDGGGDLKWEPTHQNGTSLDPSGKLIQSNDIPYFVLPGGFAQTVGIKLGDLGAVFYQDKMEFVIFADTGPKRKIGEGSICLHRSLGFERVKPDGHIRDVGIDRDVLTLVFPGSGTGKPMPADEIRAKGHELYIALGGA
jgi:hypothetical protein